MENALSNYYPPYGVSHCWMPQAPLPPPLSWHHIQQIKYFQLQEAKLAAAEQQSRVHHELA